MTECTIDWSPMPLEAWGERFRRIRRSTLLQHLPYAHAERRINQMGARHGLIRIGGEEAGLVQIGEVGLLGRLIHVVQLDRGPLWFAGFGAQDHVGAFFRAFAAEFPRSFGRKRRVLAELTDTQANRRLLADAGFLRNDRYQGYETIWVDLEPETDRLRARLDGNWRRFLSKSERTGLSVTEDWSGDTSAGFLATYDADRSAKNYSGPSRKMIETLLGLMIPLREAVILNALDGERTVAAMLILLHGSSATYLAGWNLPEGRKLGGHHRLSWHAMIMLKEKGIRDFDLGGVNEVSAQGIKHFKKGLGGTFTKLAGIYR
jgi:Acetyltransferase (GNAT) domain